MIELLNSKEAVLLFKQIANYPALILAMQGRYVLKKQIPSLPTQFYLLEHQNKKAYCCIDGSNFALIIGDIPNKEEFNIFANMCGIQTFITTSKENNCTYIKNIYEMCLFTKDITPLHKQIPCISVQKDISIKEIVQLQSSEFTNASEMDNFYAMLCNLKNYGYLHTYGLYNQSKQLVSVICAQKIDLLAPIYLLSVFTHKAYRHKGYSRYLLNALAKDFIADTIYLLCTEQNVPFYQKYNFTQKNTYTQRKITSETTFFNIPNELEDLDKKILNKIEPQFKKIEEIQAYNELKMLSSFTTNRVAANHLVGTTGYGYNDIGREKLEQVFATLTGSEAALVRPHFMSGTHTITVALFGLLRPNDVLLCATGRPYDTLIDVLGINGNKGMGSLLEFGIQYQQIDLIDDNTLNFEEIEKQAKNSTILYLQRSRGYANRPSLSLKTIEKASKLAKQANPNIHVVVDNCYGEFTQKHEPTEYGADLIMGSLIKNAGGGIAPTGGYIAGKKSLVEKCVYRLTAPGVGEEIGCTNDMLREMYLGIYFAPSVTACALKSGIYASALFEELGYTVTPKWQDERNDIVTAIHMRNADELVLLCENIQAMSPIDSFVAPEPAPMPGYDCDVIMAAGAFTSGSSIELSCDAPMQSPYVAYLQGGLNFTATKMAILMAANQVIKNI